MLLLIRPVIPLFLLLFIILCSFNNFKVFLLKIILGFFSFFTVIISNGSFVNFNFCNESKITGFDLLFRLLKLIITFGSNFPTLFSISSLSLTINNAISFLNLLIFTSLSNKLIFLDNFSI